MKTVFLARHAKSSWSSPSLQDIERPLNARGLRDAPFMGGLLKRLGKVPQQVWCSPAVRARTTATLMAEAMGLSKDQVHVDARLYPGTPDDYEALLMELPDEVGSVMIVAHNPGIAMGISAFTGEPVAHVPTAAIAEIQWDADNWQNLPVAGTWAGFEYPKKHIIL